MDSIISYLCRQYEFLERQVRHLNLNVEVPTTKIIDTLKSKEKKNENLPAN